MVIIWKSFFIKYQLLDQRTVDACQALRRQFKVIESHGYGQVEFFTSSRE